jgi:hypothetical protein
LAFAAEGDYTRTRWYFGRVRLFFTARRASCLKLTVSVQDQI